MSTTPQFEFEGKTYYSENDGGVPCRGCAFDGSGLCTKVPPCVGVIFKEVVTIFPSTVKLPAKFSTEATPDGRDAHAPGAKLDAGKVRPALVLGGFARALLAVSRVGTFGAAKYTDNGWTEVPNGISRYDDAKLRHWLTEKAGDEVDPESQLDHAAHEAWNALARLDLILRERERNKE